MRFATVVFKLAPIRTCENCLIIGAQWSGTLRGAPHGIGARLNRRRTRHMRNLRDNALVCHYAFYGPRDLVARIPPAKSAQN